MNLNEDPLLSGVIFHYLGAGAGETTVGRKDADQPPAVCLSGLRYASRVVWGRFVGGEHAGGLPQRTQVRVACCLGTVCR